VTSNAFDQAVANQLGVAGTKGVINGYTRAQRSESLNRLLKEIIKEQIWIEKLKRGKRKLKPGS
jgi:hypothetical protein